jgi:anionic cell wall polymer biosynthesis LytR-Cps2A-Psr (LCP) family protein
MQRLGAFLARPFVAAFLSAVLPGAGQAAAGERRRGGIVAIPAVSLLGLLLWLVVFDRHALLDSATNQQWLISLGILNVPACIYHFWAMADAYVLARRRLRRQRRPLSNVQKWTNSLQATEPVSVGRTYAPGAPRPMRPVWMSIVAVAILVSGPLFVHVAFAVEDFNLQGAAGCLNSPIPCWMLGDVSSTDSQAPLAQNDNNVDVPTLTDSSSPGVSSESPSASTSAGALASLPAPELPQMETSQNSADWAKDGMLNLLLVGVDQAPGRSDFLTDTMILVQVNIKTGQSAMYSVARNMYCTPLPKGVAENFPNPDSSCDPGTFDVDMLNGLWYDAAKLHPQWYPFYPRSDCDDKSGSDKTSCITIQDYKRGIFALEQAIGTLTGVHVDGTALINLPGFARLIDDLGGVDINVQSKVTDYPCGPKGTEPGTWRVCDLRTDLPYTNGQCAAYVSGKYRGDHCHYGYSLSDGTGAVVAKMKADAASQQTIQGHWGPDIAFTIQPGVQHMDGEWALAYARTRIYYTDYDRMARQQLVLQAIRNTVTPCSVLPKLLDPNGLLKDLGNLFWTNMPTDGSTLTTLAGLAQHVTGASVQRFSLDPNTLSSPKGTTRISKTGWAMAQNIVRHGLDNAPAATGGSGGSGGGGFGC